jgi:hypothetical protein
MSGLTWQTLRDTDFAGLGDVAALWGAYIDYATGAVVDVPEEVGLLSEAGEEYFAGPVAEAARGYVTEVTAAFEEDLAERAVRIKTLFEDAAERFADMQSRLDDLLAEAGGALRPTGGVGEERFKVTAQFASDHHQAEATDEQLRLFERAEALSAELSSLMAEARGVDAALADELNALDDSAPALPPVVGEPGFAARNGEYLRQKHEDFLEKVENGDASPAEVADWWNSMSEEERALFVATAPDLVGPMDGIPTEDRDTANRDLLEEEITDLDAQIARMEAELEHTPRDGRYIDLEAELDALREQRDSLNNLNDQIAEPYSEGGHEADYYLLGYSSAADGQAIVSVGNPDTADNVNVYVPGTGANLADVDGVLGRAETMFHDASEYGGGSTTASILWLGYDAPDAVQPSYDGDSEGWEAGASSEQYAEDAAGDLSSFVNGLRATDQGGAANLTMTGHSYGSTTIGVTARDQGLDVDNMIFVGSPGVGVDNAADLGIDPDNVWASTNSDDVIQYGTVHGENPNSEDFGGNTFTSDATREGERPFNSGGNVPLGAAGGLVAELDGALENHSAYWDEGNAARDNMAFIITAQPEEVT